MEKRISRPAFTGVVVSDKMDKTIVVLVQTHKPHAMYVKRVKYGKKYYAHDEKNEAKIGDSVTIMATRKLSATKRYRLISINAKAIESIKAAEAELLLEQKAEEIVDAKVASATAEVKVEAEAAPLASEAKAE